VVPVKVLRARPVVPHPAIGAGIEAKSRFIWNNNPATYEGIECKVALHSFL
jgi:hypothetical protein